MGLSNAFIAVADDATAAVWNPAGLLFLQSPEFSLALEYFSQDQNMSSTSNLEAKSRKTVQVEDLNYASAVLPFYYLTNIVLSINYLTLYRFDKFHRFPTQTQGDFSRVDSTFEFDQDGELSVIAPAFALAATDNLFLGFTFNIWNDSLTQTSAFTKKETDTRITTFPDFDNVARFSQTHVDETFTVNDGYSFVLGGLYRFNDRWNIGAVVKPAFTLQLEHRRVVSTIITDSNGTRPLPTNRFTEHAELAFPWILGAGIAWRPYDPLTLTADLTWTNWSEFEFKENGITTNPISGQLRSAGKLDDAITFRIGYEYIITHNQTIIPFRCGFAYDPSPSIGAIDDVYALSTGIGIKLGKYNLDFGYQFRWGNDVNSIIFQGLEASENIREHRVLASLIYYF